MFKTCIVGAGAIGGFIGTRLAMTGQTTVSAIAIGETLASLRSHGWQLETAGQTITAPVEATDDAASLGHQDLLVIALKGNVLPLVAPSLAPLIGPDTVVMPAMNGVPWWFNAGLEGRAGEPLTAVDPGGVIAAAIPAAQVLGCVVHASCTSPRAGVARHVMGNGLIVGEAFGGESARAAKVVGLLKAAGFDASLSRDIRYDVWYKLWGNLTMNPVSAITGATVDRMLADPLVRGFCSAAMQEAARIGERLGCAISQDPEERHAITAKLGAFKTSMLQDAEGHRPLEIDSIVAAVHELGQRVEVSTPSIAALLGLSRLFGRMRGLYPEDGAH
ncbi:2-dehydropantoate 2-reductase [Herbaspirillum sp. NPDC087042]|uniref:2-dehydropantoate 2-reductase n=1 Tax=Herbaspirillum sp. NPDC087042 TaxID=3364004 RepID=UPI003826BBE8